MRSPSTAATGRRFTSGCADSNVGTGLTRPGAGPNRAPRPVAVTIAPAASGYALSMSDPSIEPGQKTTADSDLDPEEYGTLTVEDEGGETVDPADLAGTASEDDQEIGYSPEHSGDQGRGA